MLDGVETSKVECKYCFKLLANSINGTGHLIRHSQKCMSQPNDSRKSQLGYMMGPSGDNVMNNFIYSQSKMREGLALYTAAFEHPFSFGQDPNFEEFQQTYVNSQFKRVSRNTVRKKYRHVI